MPVIINLVVIICIDDGFKDLPVLEVPPCDKPFLYEVQDPEGCFCRFFTSLQSYFIGDVSITTFKSQFPEFKNYQGFWRLELDNKRHPTKLKAHLHTDSILASHFMKQINKKNNQFAKTREAELVQELKKPIEKRKKLGFRVKRMYFDEFYPERKIILKDKL